MISFFTSQFGPFPFDVYGALVVDRATRLRARDADAVDLR